MQENEEPRRDELPVDVRDGDVLVYMQGRLLVVDHLVPGSKESRIVADHLVPEAFTIDLVELDQEAAALRAVRGQPTAPS